MSTDSMKADSMSTGEMNTGTMKKRKFQWQRLCYYLSGLLLLLPCWYLWQALHPQFPAEWPEQRLGPISAAPMPLDDAAPYAHDGALQKDFSVRFCAGCIAQIRQAYLSVGPVAAALPDNADGILHGNNLLQHVHAPFPLQIGADDQLWLTVQLWNGELHRAAWPIPEAWQNTQ